MTPTNAPIGGTTVTAPTPPPVTGSSKKGRKGHKRTHAYVPPAGMTADSSDGNSQAAHLDHPGLPVYYPKLIPTNYSYCYSFSGNCNVGYEPASAYAASYPRHYSITGTDGKRYPSYVMTLSYGSGGQTDTAYGRFATVEGTTWTGAGHEAGPPILRKPSEEKYVNGKLLYIYSQGGSVTLVAWQTRTAVYWVSNDLQNLMPNSQMVAMAASFTRAAG
jgi:hypothetical protein